MSLLVQSDISNVIISNVIISNVIISNVIISNVIISNVIISNVIISNVIIRNVIISNFVLDYRPLLSDFSLFQGLFVAGVFSGALSTVSSGLNSLAAVTLQVSPHFSAKKSKSTNCSLLALGNCDIQSGMNYSVLNKTKRNE